MFRLFYFCSVRGVFVSLSLQYKGNNIILLCKHFGRFSLKKIPTQTITAGGANTKQKKVWNKETYRRYIVNYALT